MPEVGHQHTGLRDGYIYDGNPMAGMVPPLIRPFAGLRPAPGFATDVLAPPYDVLNTEEARARAEGHPWSFLHISRPEIDFPEGVNPYDPAIYAKAAENLERMMDQGVLIRNTCDCYYTYRIIMNDHVQTGLVTAASVDAYNSGRIRKHEFTRPDKEDDRTHQIEALNAQTGPVFLACRASGAVNRLLAQVAEGEPDMDVTANDGIRHMLWVIDDATRIAELDAAFATMDTLYIADGHHRAAAAARVAAARNQHTPGAGEQAWDYFLAAIFPHDQLRILDYNRVITDLNGLSTDAFLSCLAIAFSVVPMKAPVRPTTRTEFGMFLSGRWFCLRLRPDLVPDDDPVGRLAVSLLADNLIAPILGIDDPRCDARIDFIGGVRGLEALEQRVDSGQMAVAFSLYPTSMEELMAVADCGTVMPPKSTWFEPKLADGVVSYLLDGQLTKQVQHAVQTTM